MKSAAFIFGVIAGLLGVGVFVLGNIDASLAAAASFGPDHDTIARLIAYLVPAVCWLGAGLALGYPRLGGLVLLLSAAAWAGIAVVAGHGAVFFAAAPFIFAAAGGLVALFARRPAKRPQYVDAGTDFDSVITEAVTAAEPERREPAPPRTSPTLVDARLPPMRRDETSLESRPATRIPPPFQDIFLDQDQAPDPANIEPDPAKPETPQDADEVEVEQRAVTAETEEPPVNAPADTDVTAVASPHPRRASEWKLPTPAAAPGSPRYAADRQSAAPARIEPLAPAAPPAPDQRSRGVSTLDFGAANEVSARRGGPAGRGDAEASAAFAENGRFGRRQDADDAPAFKPDAPGETTPRGGGVRRALRLLIALLFILVLLAIAAAVYLDYRRGAQSILFGRHLHVTAAAGLTTGPATGTQPPSAQPAPVTDVPASPTVPATPSPPFHAAPQPAAMHQPASSTPAPTPPAIVASTPAAEAAPAPVSPAPAAPVPLAPDAPAPTAAPSLAQPAVVAAAPTPPVTATADAASPTSFTDPNAYCAAVGTIEAPDARYTGPAVPGVVAAALVAPQSTAADQIHWRCANGAAFACNAHNTNACMPTPTVDGMLKYCALHADAKNLPAPNGSWSCNGTRPVIPEDQSWPVDPQGFFPGAWIRVSPVG